jgi:hypothetical protein
MFSQTGRFSLVKTEFNLLNIIIFSQSNNLDSLMFDLHDRITYFFFKLSKKNVSKNNLIKEQ